MNLDFAPAGEATSLERFSCKSTKAVRSAARDHGPRAHVPLTPASDEAGAEVSSTWDAARGAAPSALPDRSKRAGMQTQARRIQLARHRRATLEPVAATQRRIRL